MAKICGYMQAPQGQELIGHKRVMSEEIGATRRIGRVGASASAWRSERSSGWRGYFDKTGTGRREEEGGKLFVGWREG